MNRQTHGLAIAAIVLVLACAWAATARAAMVTKVDRGAWTGGANVPSYVTMYIYVPDAPATKPPIVVACHSCGTPVSGYVSSISTIQSTANENGFILILPEATGRNCWDVGSAASLKHDGGGDTQAVAQMVKYALTKYGGDPSRVYVMGGSSGAMMTQAMLAVYPDLFKAGSARAGVPAGCWADGYDPSQQWSGRCAGGQTNKTAQQWGDGVRAMDPGYAGHRPRVQLFHGTADGTINYNNMGEAIEEWTNVLGLPTTPTSTDMITTSISSYTRQFWKNACGFTVFETWAAKNGGHSMGYEQDAILAFFGLDKVGGPDPETACSGDGGVPETDGGTGRGGSGGAAGGGTGGAAGHAGAGGGSGGTGAGGHGDGAGGAAGTPGSGGSTGTGVAGGPAGSTGTTGAGGVSGGGGAGRGVAGAPSTGAAGSPGGGGNGGDDGGRGGGCSYAPLGGAAGAGLVAHLLALVAGLGLIVSRRRGPRR
jgi:acetylxylan esterase